MLSATGLGMHFGAQTLFEGADLRLDKGKRYGIVGANGSGKSTLLRILAGQETSTAGEVNVPKRARIGVLEQDHFQYEAVRILDLVMMGNPLLWDAMVEKEKVLETEPFDEVRYGDLEDIVLRFDGYTLESRAAQILEGLGVPTEVHHQPLSVLSGGFKLRALLAKALAAEPDLLFLDEPTNHLDILAIRWLEEFLSTFKGCAAVVSHDLKFMDAICTHILDVDYERVILYPGNYTRFTVAKLAERERLEAEIRKRQKEISEHKAFIQRFKAKATKARQANSRQKRLEKITINELPRSSRRHPNFRFTQTRPSGREVLKVRDLHKAYGENTVLDGVDFTVQRGDRLAVIGPNGVGKSTLLKILVGEIEADLGTAEWGYEARFGYFPQNHEEALGDSKQSVKASLWETLPEDGLGAILARLASVLFSKDDADKAIENLSGGEGARLLFARLDALSPPVLVMDEPTNHLDLEGIEALAEALMKYEGTLLFVSHDRWFVDKLATRVLEIRHEGVDLFDGTYAEFMSRGAEDHLDRDAVVQANRQSRKKKRKNKGR